MSVLALVQSHLSGFMHKYILCLLCELKVMNLQQQQRACRCDSHDIVVRVYFVSVCCD